MIYQECNKRDLELVRRYLPDRNICIEYQGEQHYEPICFGGISLSKAEDNFQDNIKRDNIKRNYCLNNSIKLIEISYKNKSRIREIILESLT